MKFEFIKVKNTHYNIDYGYVLKLSNLVQLMGYLTDDKMAESIFFDIVNSERRGAEELSITSPAGMVEKISEVTGENTASVLSRMTSDRFKSMSKAIDEYGSIYVQWTGGWMVGSIVEYGKPKYSENPRNFPKNYTDEDIKLSKWPGGKHWYAKVGTMDVEVDGQVKWNTQKRAKEMANRFIEELD